MITVFFLGKCKMKKIDANGKNLQWGYFSLGALNMNNFLVM